MSENTVKIEREFFYFLKDIQKQRHTFAKLLAEPSFSILSALATFAL